MSFAAMTKNAARMDRIYATIQQLGKSARSQKPSPEEVCAMRAQILDWFDSYVGDGEAAQEAQEPAPSSADTSIARQALTSAGEPEPHTLEQIRRTLGAMDDLETVRLMAVAIGLRLAELQAETTKAVNGPAVDAAIEGAP